VAGVHSVYIFGILVSAVGMSLYLAHSLGQSRLVEIENERKTHELTQARELQLSMLPRELPKFSGLDLAAATQTAAEVGGDYYDLKPAAPDAVLVAFGDATGHGLASGVLVTAAKALFTSLPGDGPLAEMLEACDRVLREMRLGRLQMCLTLARISPREAAVASAAMPPVLLHRAATGAIEELGAGGLPLGSPLAARYEERRTPLAPGDTLLFASDGFAELLDSLGNELGFARAAETFREAARGVSASSVAERLGAAVSSFRGARPQEDDVTFLVVRVTPSL
ncbi:MAG TPA: SpoIIE family protein phosphatase, partial [Thermoanaerobaculia bacterium]|nr:SpoIIE family protein phosphatase [Thermoanaerobaculia bacterium]